MLVMTDARAERRNRLVIAAAALVLAVQTAPNASGQTGTLAAPFPPPSPNAALHYQRGLLLMSALDEADHALLKKNVWEVLPGSQPAAGEVRTIKRLLYRARHAADAAGKGARLQVCDFGIDFADAGGATVLPHVQPMVELGRLLAIRGMYAQSQGRWDDAAVIYFDGLRMGQHLTHQSTLLEAMAGMQILDDHYYALAQWAASCPDVDAVARAFGLFEIMAGDMIHPARTLARETCILAMDFAYLERVYPNGPWGEAILLALDQQPGDDEQENRKQAIAACVAAGVPEDVFKNTSSFGKYLAGLKQLDMRFAEAAAACMKLPPKARLQRGQRLYSRYGKAAGALGQESLLNPAEIGALFADHEAKVAVLRVALAVSARRGDQGFPATLDAVGSGFGGTVPTSPYDGAPIEYEVREDGQAFRLAIARVRVAGVVLPRVEFTNDVPEAAE